MQDVSSHGTEAPASAKDTANAVHEPVTGQSQDIHEIIAPRSCLKRSLDSSDRSGAHRAVPAKKVRITTPGEDMLDSTPTAKPSTQSQPPTTTIRRNRLGGTLRLDGNSTQSANKGGMSKATPGDRRHEEHEKTPAEKFPAPEQVTELDLSTQATDFDNPIQLVEHLVAPESNEIPQSQASAVSAELEMDEMSGLFDEPLMNQTPPTSFSTARHVGATKDIPQIQNEQRVQAQKTTGFLSGIVDSIETSEIPHIKATPAVHKSRPAPFLGQETEKVPTVSNANSPSMPEMVNSAAGFLTQLPPFNTGPPEPDVIDFSATEEHEKLSVDSRVPKVASRIPQATREPLIQHKQALISAQPKLKLIAPLASSTSTQITAGLGAPNDSPQNNPKPTRRATSISAAAGPKNAPTKLSTEKVLKVSDRRDVPVEAKAPNGATKLRDSQPLSKIKRFRNLPLTHWSWIVAK